MKNQHKDNIPIQQKIENIISKRFETKDQKPDKITSREKDQKAKREEKTLELDIEDRNLKRKQRSLYAKLTFIFLVVWSGFFWVAVFLNQYIFPGERIGLLYTLTGATSINIIALYLAIIKSLFPKTEKNDTRGKIYA